MTPRESKLPAPDFARNDRIASPQDCPSWPKPLSLLALPPSAISSRPLSESLLNEKWDRCLSNLLVKSTLGLGFGVVFSVLLFKRRAWPAFVGVGFGAGRAYEECNFSLKQAARDLKKQSA
ncbi:Mitochondrial inner membrane organizing system component [Fusarium falciforme]|nr:Mitochondrial inner membrane organizing system component [Fusarium falciforme]